MTINLGDPRGVEVAKKLIAWADVVVENFGPGYMDRIGLDWDTLQQVRPGIILASVSVAGRTGPLSGFRGYGNSAAAWSGHCDMTGWPESEPHMPPFAYGDVVAPMMLTMAILSALEHRDRTGEGVHVDVSQIESMVNVIGDLFAERPTDKPANNDPLMKPHGVFPCKDDRWIAIACETDDHRTALAGILGDGTLEQATAEFDAFELEQRLIQAGVPAAVVLDGKGLAEHPDLKAAGHFVPVDHPVIGRANMPAPPYILPDTPTQVRPSPCLGADNAMVFAEIGLTEAEVQDLTAEGVLV